jgi:hypothetical protein
MPKVILGVLLLVLPFIGRASTIPSISATALLGNGVGDTISQPGTLSFSFSGPISSNNGMFLYSGPGSYYASADASYGNVTANTNAGCGGDEVCPGAGCCRFSCLRIRAVPVLARRTATWWTREMIPLLRRLNAATCLPIMRPFKVQFGALSRSTP